MALRPNGLPFSCRERALRHLQKRHDLAREAVGCNGRLCEKPERWGADPMPVILDAHSLPSCGAVVVLDDRNQCSSGAAEYFSHSLTAGWTEAVLLKADGSCGLLIFKSISCMCQKTREGNLFLCRHSINEIRSLSGKKARRKIREHLSC
jgi:hypothetical protein